MVTTGRGAEKRARDSGSAVNADPGEKHGTVASQTKTTRRLDQSVKRDADGRMAGGGEAVGQWEGEGGSAPQAKKGGRK